MSRAVGAGHQADLKGQGRDCQGLVGLEKALFIKPVQDLLFLDLKGAQGKGGVGIGGIEVKAVFGTVLQRALKPHQGTVC